VAIRSDQHRNLNMLVAKTRDAACPLSFNGGPPFETEAELDEKRNRIIERFYNDAYVVHPLESHAN
jgi:hypothetical protein